MMTNLLNGIFPALVTPFRNNRFDEASFRSYVQWLLESGVHGLVACGTTGEAATLTRDEYAQVIRCAVEEAGGKVPVIAGAGSNSTAQALELSQLAADCGANALLHVTPYYNKPTQAGLLAHYQVLELTTPLPILLYNVPGRTGCNLSAATVSELAQSPGIIGLKDASGSIAQATETMLGVPPHFRMFSGDDLLNYPLFALGYHGAISVTANILPREMVALWKETQDKNLLGAQAAHRSLYAINQALFLESNPIPVKTALAAMGKCAEEWRLPLTPMMPQTKAQLLTVLQASL